MKSFLLICICFFLSPLHYYYYYVTGIAINVQLVEIPFSLDNLNTHSSRRDDDDDDPTFWEVTSSFGRNRWTSLRNGFSEFWDVVKAGGRELRNMMATND